MSICVIAWCFWTLICLPIDEAFGAPLGPKYMCYMIR
uniref:Uncharacterized protein n=1 Tax=Rhizophora mucronata TaxID=61149 RepID=A0A2P2QEK1_RHIMU